MTEKEDGEKKKPLGKKGSGTSNNSEGSSEKHPDTKSKTEKLSPPVLALQRDWMNYRTELQRTIRNILAHDTAHQIAMRQVAQFHAQHMDSVNPAIDAFRDATQHLPINALIQPFLQDLQAESHSFTFSSQNKKGRPKFEDLLAEDIGRLNAKRFPHLSKQLAQIQKRQSAQELVIVLSAVIDRGMRNILFYVLCIELGCDTKTTQRHLERYWVNEANIYKDVYTALSASTRKVQKKNKILGLQIIFESQFQKLLLVSNSKYEAAKRVRNGIAHGNRVGGTLSSGSLWKKLSSIPNTICQQAAIQQIQRITALDQAFKDSFGIGSTSFKPFDGKLSGFRPKTNELTAEQTEILLSSMLEGAVVL